MKSIAAPIPSPILQPIKHLRACFTVCHRKLPVLQLLLCAYPELLSLGSPMLGKRNMDHCTNQQQQTIVIVKKERMG
jgi:hypothetical protein